jgi:hypothetical protein
MDINVMAYKPLTEEETQDMQEHINKVKLTNPQQYNDMIERAGENVTHCCGCHQEICGLKSSTNNPDGT